jgi:hypothetical protein
LREEAGIFGHKIIQVGRISAQQSAFVMVVQQEFRTYRESSVRQRMWVELKEASTHVTTMESLQALALVRAHLAK